jgi:hypothetical protein
MKKILIISILFFVAYSAKSQTVNITDTLTYLKTIETNKANYIGRPFSSLMNDLQIQIKYFSPIASIHFDKSKETSTSFCFYYPLNADEVYLTYPCIRIEWDTPLNANQSSIIYNSNDGGMWLLNASLFYANAIIKNIRVSE